jgi:CheY-like chemotaxis protein
MEIQLEEIVSERTADLLRTVDTLQEEAALRALAEETLQHRSEQLRALASELTRAEQRERQRLAQVLHDGLQQILVGAKYRIASMERSDDPKQFVCEVASLIDDAIETSRSLTAELSPPILIQGGFLAALKWLVRWMHDKHGLDVNLTARERFHLPQGELILFLFQSIRELLFNVIKHAGVKKACIQVIRLENEIQVTVEDEGSGFDQTQLRGAGGSSGGFGLFSISERLSMLGGRMTVDSALGAGSRIALFAPLPSSKSKAASPSIEGPAMMSAPITSEPESEAASSKKKIRVVLVDDHIVMRQGLAGLLRAEADMEIVGEASDGESAVNLIRQIHPDVVLMDISMPGMNGIQATRIIHSELPEVRVIGLSMFQEGEQAAAMREAGAADYVTKSGPSEAVIATIRACVQWYHPKSVP